MRKVQIFKLGTKRNLGPKFGLWDPINFKTDYWGPGESIHTYIVRFLEKGADF